MKFHLELEYPETKMANLPYTCLLIIDSIKEYKFIEQSQIENKDLYRHLCGYLKIESGGRRELNDTKFHFPRELENFKSLLGIYPVVVYSEMLIFE